MRPWRRRPSRGRVEARLRPALSGRTGLVSWLLLVLFAFAAAPGAADAQTHGLRAYSEQEARWVDADWRDDVTFAASNALVSGIAAAVVAAFRDEVTVGDAFLSGAVGGLAVYAGKRVAAARFDGAGLLGRQVSALGASVGRNGAAGRAPFDELVVPLGLGRLYWNRAEGGVRFRPDLNAIGWSLTAAFESRLALDWGHSISAGAPVFLTRGSAFEDGAAGRAYGDVILADSEANLPLEDILAHERVHVLQLDQHYILWGEAMEQGALRLLGDRVQRVGARLDLVGPTLVTGLGLGALWPGQYHPMESEAYYMQMRGEPAWRHRVVAW